MKHMLLIRYCQSRIPITEIEVISLCNTVSVLVRLTVFEGELYFTDSNSPCFSYGEFSISCWNAEK